MPLGLFRVAWIAAVDGLLGGALGLTVAMLLGRRATLSRVTGAVAVLPAFVAAAVVVNRVVLRDVHHLEPISLAMDIVAAAAAVGVAVLVGRVMAPTEARLLSVLGPRTAVVVGTTLAGIGLVPFFPQHGGTPDPGRPPVVVLSIDTLRPDRLGDGGQPMGTSPELDRLCRRARTFQESFAVSPGYGASHAALMT
jgi:hypothetical protein